MKVYEKKERELEGTPKIDSVAGRRSNAIFLRFRRGGHFDIA